MTQEQLRMQMLAGIITEGEYKSKLSEWGGGNSERDERDRDSRRDRERREGMTPEDHWGNDIDGYINHLIHRETYQNINGKITTLRGIAALESILSDHLDDKKSYSYQHAKGRGYYDFMKKVRERYLELKKAGKIKDTVKNQDEDSMGKMGNPNPSSKDISNGDGLNLSKKWMKSWESDFKQIKTIMDRYENNDPIKSFYDFADEVESELGYKFHENLRWSFPSTDGFRYNSVWVIDNVASDPKQEKLIPTKKIIHRGGPKNSWILRAF